jgi:cytochrome c peroxidase
MKALCFNRLDLVAKCVVLFALGTTVAKAQSKSMQVWDPPAITVFPDHNKVARSPDLLPSMVKDGELLFKAKFNILDGAGRPASTGDSKPTPRPRRDGDLFTRISGPDSNSCAGCHYQPKVGGSGEFVANVFVGAHFKDPPALSIAQEITNERNTISLFGSGSIELLAREMTRDLRTQREEGQRKAVAALKDVEIHLITKGVDFGRIFARPDGSYDETHLDGVDPDLVVKPFGVKGIAVSLREFSIAALNQHHGMQAIERFGWQRTGRQDFDEDGVAVEFTIGQLSALVLFQASLPAPSRLLPGAPFDTEVQRRGEQLFNKIGCATCHIPSLKLQANSFSEPNPYNRPGTITLSDVEGPIDLLLPAGGSGNGVQVNSDGTFSVFAFSDLKRHRICDSQEPFFCNERLRQDNVPTDEFLTAKLWDLATSAPYGHRGDCGTVSEVIIHHGGEAAQSRRQFQALFNEEKRALIAFLLSLGAGSY